MYKVGLLLIFLIGSFSSSDDGSQDTHKKQLDFLYIGTPPYVFSINGEIDGIFIEPVETVVSAAGFSVSWVRMAPNRGFRNFEKGEKPYCVVSQAAYYSSDQEHNWFISDSFASLGTIGLLVRAEDREKMQMVPTIKILVEQSPYKGGFLRIALEKYQEEMLFSVDPAKHLIVDSNPFEMGQLVARGRIDFLIVSEKAVAVHKSFYDDIRQLAFIEMPGIPQKKRQINIVCNEAIDQDVMNSINLSIESLNRKAAQ